MLQSSRITTQTNQLEKKIIIIKIQKTTKHVEKT